MLDLRGKKEPVDVVNDSIEERGDKTMRRVDNINEIVNIVVTELKKLKDKKKETRIELKFCSVLDGDRVVEHCNDRLWYLFEEGDWLEKLYWAGENGSFWNYGPSSSDGYVIADEEYYRKGDFVAKYLNYNIETEKENGILTVVIETYFEYVFRNIFDDEIICYDVNSPEISEEFYNKVKVVFIKEASRRKENSEPPAWLEGFGTEEEYLECWMERINDEEYCEWMKDNYTELKVRLVYWENECGRPATDEEVWHIWNKEFKKGA